MKQLTITYVTFENGKREQHTVTEIVASTKSENALVDDYNHEEKFIKDKKAVEFFVNKAVVAKALETALASNYSGETLTALVNHAIKALDGACMFERPKK